MRKPLLLLLLAASAGLSAQLSVGAHAGAGSMPGRPASLGAHPLPVTLPGLRPLDFGPGTRGPAPSPKKVEPPAFDFAATKPHLAFFCRLELDIERATRFPVRFRLGEVRTWQQELSKRD